MEQVKALGAGTLAKHPLFARAHDCAADLQSTLLGVACVVVDAVCERRGDKAGYEKD
jgi:hypothetical protein